MTTDRANGNGQEEEETSVSRKRPRAEVALDEEDEAKQVGSGKKPLLSNGGETENGEKEGYGNQMMSVVVAERRLELGRQRLGIDCPYMDTINRSVLDFDFEKVCSVSLEKHNVYACLVCGKYFQGRGRNSHAYFHCLEQSHHVFVNLETERVYCLPDGYEIIDSSLDDIKNAINPRFSPETVAKLDSQPVRYRALDGKIYLQGVMGMNNLHKTDYVNTVLQALLAVVPLRDFFLLFPSKGAGSNLARTLGELMRKLYNPRAFRAHISPHEFVQDVVSRSQKRFKILEQGDPVELLAWLLNTLHSDLEDKNGNSKIQQIFRGEVTVTTEKDAGTDQDGSADGETENREPKRVKRKSKRVPYFFLSLDLPPRPLFKDSMNRKLLPQVPLFTLLSKFDGVKAHHVVKTGERRFYRIERLPNFLVMHIKRFQKNNFFVEKNPTIVPFPAKNLELRDFLSKSAVASSPATKYDLVAAVVHEGQLDGGTYTVNVRHPPTQQWFQIQDLNVKETLPQLVTLAEAHILIYEAQRNPQ